MTQETSVETQQGRTQPVTKVRIHLKDPLPEDLEIHTFLPNSLKRFEQALARGDLEELMTRLAADDQLI